MHPTHDHETENLIQRQHDCITESSRSWRLKTLDRGTLLYPSIWGCTSNEGPCGSAHWNPRASNKHPSLS